MFLNRICLNTVIVDFELFSASPFIDIAQLNSDRCQHSGLLIEQSSYSAVNSADNTISDFDFAIFEPCFVINCPCLCLSTTR